MKTVTHQKISDDLFLIYQPPAREDVTPARAITHHLVIVDCSGSMTADLPKLRHHLKNKLGSLITPGDTVSLIWFSGKGQHGSLIESQTIDRIANLQDLSTSIDRWLKPVGMTGFLEPLQDALTAIFKRKLAKIKEANSLFFMSDGCDNQWTRDEIFEQLKKMVPYCAAATFVEYGYYADRKMLADMAALLGGVHIFAEDFVAYQPIFEKVMAQRAVLSPRVFMGLFGARVAGEKDIAFCLGDNLDLQTFRCVQGCVEVPEHQGFYYFSTVPAGDPGQMDAGVCYAALSLHAMRMRPDIVYPLLNFLGDVDLIEQYSTCFGKQKYTAFAQRCEAAVFDTGLRFAGGRKVGHVPGTRQFTVFDLLKMLTASGASTTLLCDSVLFDYKRIGQQQVPAADKVNAANVAEYNKLAARFAELASRRFFGSFISGTLEAMARDLNTIKEIGEAMDAIRQQLTDRSRISYEVVKAPDGYPVDALVTNEERPNLSIRVKKQILIDLNPEIKRVTDEALRERLSRLPAPFPSYIWRNYTVIKDGVVNLDVLPVRSSGAIENHFLKEMPVLNRTQAGEIKAKSTFELEWQLVNMRAVQKVYNHYQKEFAPKQSSGYAIVYGTPVADWLAALGITDHGGYHPPMEAVPTTDCYLSKTLDIRLKGYASLPSISEVKDRMTKGGKPLTGAAALMAPIIAQVQSTMESASREHFVSWISGMQKAAMAKTRMLLLQKAEIVFSVVVGQLWFSEWATLEENSMELNLPGADKPVTGFITMKEEEVWV